MQRALFVSKLVRCPRCEGLTTAKGTHAPRWTVVDGKHVQVDCKGNVIREVPR